MGEIQYKEVQNGVKIKDHDFSSCKAAIELKQGFLNKNSDTKLSLLPEQERQEQQQPSHQRRKKQRDPVEIPQGQ